MPHSTILFVKLHGLGNDFVLIDARETDYGLTRTQIKAIADRKFGVGFDQLLYLKSSPRVHAVLDIYNADGSLAEMCGNGLRAAALYLWTRGKSRDTELVFETKAGDRRARHIGPAANGNIECEMGIPKIKTTPKAFAKGVKLGGKNHLMLWVDSGVPHAIVFGHPKDAKQLEEWGRHLENHKAFSKRTNVMFVQVKDRHILDVKVWERGAGATLACGTGGVAAAAAAIHLGVAQSPVEIRFPGGQAEVQWDGPKQSATLRGHAEEVFLGEWLGA